MGEVFLQSLHCRFGNRALGEVCYFVFHDCYRFLGLAPRGAKEKPAFGAGSVFSGEARLVLASLHCEIGALETGR